MEIYFFMTIVDHLSEIREKERKMENPRDKKEMIICKKKKMKGTKKNGWIEKGWR